jgi:secondary thiamine-phosphate synthase enzyme
MKTHRKLLWFHTRERTEIIDITAEVEGEVRESGIREGLALIFPMHTSSAVYVSDSDRSLTRDLDALLARLAPRGAGYQHDAADPKGNADGHLKAILCGHHVTLPVSEGRLDLGTWQTLYYAEFDGRRDKEVQIRILGE